jgi:16S rRNA (uracil1498-N3)-methyltransferase
MARRRFYAPPDAFDTGAKTVRLAEEEARHLRDVLRLKQGDEVFVFDGEGSEFKCLVTESGRDSARLEIVAAVSAASPESPLRLTLALALLKGEKFDLAVQKATELGAARIVPVMTKLADVRPKDERDSLKRVSRWQRISLEAAKQSGRARVPEICAPVSFAELVQSGQGEAEVRLLFSERGGASLLETIAGWSNNPQAVTVLVGAEGGWTDEELALARSAAWSIITLGGRILRAETAAIAVTVLLQHLCGDLR